MEESICFHRFSSDTVRINKKLDIFVIVGFFLPFANYFFFTVSIFFTSLEHLIQIFIICYYNSS